MRYQALATDYDGTLAHHGALEEATVEALERFRKSGRRLVLVTGRELDELLEVCPRIDLFDRVVAENGALLYRPDCREEKRLAEAPPEKFVAALRRRGVAPISTGRVIVATWEPHQAAVLEVIHDMGLELHVIFNKGAVMILPSGVNKATGLEAALAELELSAHNTVGVGDAENDHAFLASCEFAVAVQNALPTLKERADLVTAGERGAGVVELINNLLADDLAGFASRLGRHSVLLGPRDDGTEERLEPYGVNILVAGTSGSGKSRMTTGLLERFAEPGYQYVIIDPEGDYASLEKAVVLGDPHRAPTVTEVMDLLCPPRQEVVVNLLGIALEHRPSFFQSLLPRLQEMRARTGRPHWIVVDEAHHLLPVTWDPASLTLPQKLDNMMFVTVHPESVARPILESVGTLLVVGESPDKTIKSFCDAVGQKPPRLKPTSLDKGDVLLWRRECPTPILVHSVPSRSEHSRHSRKYAEGNLGPDRSFRFRGPEGKLNLQAQNLVLFRQMASGVDDDTWLYHLRQGDYSQWFGEGVKDPDLAADAKRIEHELCEAPADQSREAIQAAIEKRYTLPENAPSGDVASERPT